MYSRVIYNGTGVVTPYAVPFPYLDQSHVQVRIADVLLDPATYTWANSSAISINAPAGVLNLDIRRATPALNPNVVYNDGSTLTAPDLNTETLQLLYLAQEISDLAGAALGIGTGGDYNAKGHRITNLGYPLNNTDAATLGAARDVAEQVTSGAQGALGAFIQNGVGMVTRTFQDKMRDIVSIKDEGVLGNGSDETAKIQNVLNASSGKVLVLGQSETYGITSINIPNDVTIISNGSKFRKLAESSAFAITGGLRLNADRLWLTTVGGPTDTGIFLNGGGMQIGEIRIESDTVDSGTVNIPGNSINWVNGLLIGPVTGTVSRDQIGAIYVSNFCRPIVFRNMRMGKVGFTQINGFRRGVYVVDCQDMDLGDASVTGLSPSSVGVPGDNGLLVEATLAAGSTADIRVGSWHVEDSGEHAFRLGGSLPIRGFWAKDLHAVRPGSGSASTGGSGFKVLGSSNTSYHYDIYVDNLLVEDGASKGGNFCGVQLGLVDGCQINNAIVRTRNNTFSTYDGISILSCNNTQINNPIIKDPFHLGARFYTAPDAGFPNGTYDTWIHGGYLDTSAGSGYPVVQFDGNGGALNGRIARSGIRGNTLIRRGSVAVNANSVTTGGFYTDNFLDFTYFDSEGAGAVLTGTDKFLVNFALNTFTANNATPAAAGSTQRSTAGNDNRVYVKSAAGWGPQASSFQVTLADQTAISWTPPANTGWYVITANDITHYGQAYARTSPASVAKIAGGSAFNSASTALTGTTGTAGNVTLGAASGLMYLENRAGNSVTFTIFYMG